MKLVTTAQMRAIEKEANQHGLGYAQMMQNAGLGVAEVVSDLLRVDEIEKPMIIGLVGCGNNGGDTLVALTQLVKEGWEGLAYLICDRGADDALVHALQQAGGTIVKKKDDPDYASLDEWLENAEVLLDGVFGTGLKLPVKAEMAEVLGHVSSFSNLPLVVAMDCPSGVDCDSGEAAIETIPADLTVCMAAVKQGLLKLPAFEKVGQIVVVGIGLPDELEQWKVIDRFVAAAEDVRLSLPARPLDAHKGDFGQALIAAGSINYTGAAWLAAAGACRVGTGLVRLAVPAALHAALAGGLPEVTWLILPSEMGVISESAADVLLKNMDKANVLLIGPGLGLEETTGSFIARVLKREALSAGHGSMGFVTALKNEPEGGKKKLLPPLVVDAGGLKLLAKIEEWWKLLPDGTILTPHPGEMAVLTGLDVAEIQASRQETARKFARQWNCTVVLKGAFTIVAQPDGSVTVIPVATPALAKAGTGDVLAGMIAGLVAQGVASGKAAVAGAWLHAQAGLLAEAQLECAAAVLASDVVEEIATILSRLN